MATIDQLSSTYQCPRDPTLNKSDDPLFLDRPKNDPRMTNAYATGPGWIEAVFRGMISHWANARSRRQRRYVNIDCNMLLSVVYTNPSSSSSASSQQKQALLEPEVNNRDHQQANLALFTGRDCGLLWFSGSYFSHPFCFVGCKLAAGSEP